MENRYYIIYKPYNVVCQFTGEDGIKTLADLYDFPKNVYPVGRLDKDSEGLLILTNDRQLNNRLLHPKFKHRRTYMVQIEGLPLPDSVTQLRNGVTIKVNKKPYDTRPAKVRLLPSPPKVPDRDPPVRFRKTVPDVWLKMTLQEGKNRQVRRMTAKVGHPTLRLIRISIENLELGTMNVGEVIEMDGRSLYKALRID